MCFLFVTRGICQVYEALPSWLEFFAPPEVVPVFVVFSARRAVVLLSLLPLEEEGPMSDVFEPCASVLGCPQSGSEIRYITSRRLEKMSPAASGPAGGEIFF